MFLDASRIPVWYPVKLLFVAWLALPQFKGASFIYEKFVREQLRKYRGRTRKGDSSDHKVHIAKVTTKSFPIATHIVISASMSERPEFFSPVSHVPCRKNNYRPRLLTMVMCIEKRTVRSRSVTYCCAKSLTRCIVYLKCGNSSSS